MSGVLLVSPSGEQSAVIEQCLRTAGMVQMTAVTSCGEARRLLRSEAESPDLIVINAPLPDEFGQELAQTAALETDAALIFAVLSDIASETADRLSECGITVVPKPIDRQLLIRTIRLVTADRIRMLSIQRETSELMTQIDDMRLINRAKSTLMKYLRFTEPQAHRYIEKQAMNTRQTRREVALHILATYE